MKHQSETDHCALCLRPRHGNSALCWFCLSHERSFGRGPRRDSHRGKDPLSRTSGTALRLVPPRPEPHDFFKEIVDDALGSS